MVLAAFSLSLNSFDPGTGWADTAPAITTNKIAPKIFPNIRRTDEDESNKIPMNAAYQPQFEFFGSGGGVVGGGAVGGGVVLVFGAAASGALATCVARDFANASGSGAPPSNVWMVSSPSASLRSRNVWRGDPAGNDCVLTAKVSTNRPCASSTRISVAW